MKIRRVLLSICGFVLVCSFSLADTPIEKYLSKIAIYETEDGRNCKTFEDVYLTLNPFQERNEPYPVVNETNIPEGYVDVKTAKEYFKKFSKNAVLTDEANNFKEFMNSFFYIKFSLEGDSKIVDEFPYDYYATTPEKRKLYLCMEDGYKYVDRFKKFEPDALSCKKCPSLCGEKCESGHVYGSNNIYSNFKANLLKHAKIKEARKIENEDIYIEYTTEDRTPPSTNNLFVDLGGDPGIYACTSGDWYRTDDFKSYKKPNGDFNHFYNFLIFDNKTIETSAKFAFGRFIGCPGDGDNVEDAEDWTHTENIKRQSSEDPRFFDIVRFEPSLDGIIRYSVFSEDENENINPGIDKLKNDQPGISYGYSESIDLLDTPEDAKCWLEKGKLGSKAKKGLRTGELRIFDNDRPNIIIRVTDVLTGEQMFFPPCVASAECRITNSSKYKPLSSGIGKKNQDDYFEFVKGISPDYDHAVLYESTGLTPYFTIYEIDDNSINTKTEGGYYEKLLNNKDVDFINQNVRVEDYYFSDKEKDGSPAYTSKNGSFGKRKGTLASMTVLYENNSAFRFKTGVEYKLDVWTDDNIKWTNIEYEQDLNGQPAIERIKSKKTGKEEYSIKPKLLQNAKVYETGIKEGEIEVYVPGNSEFDHGLFDIDIKKHINGDLHFTLNNPTVEKYNFEKVEELDENEFPYIAVKARDYSGLTRGIKFYFRVNDRNIDIKVLEGSKSDRK